MTHAFNKFIANKIRTENSRVIRHKLTNINSRGDDYNQDDVKELSVRNEEANEETS